MPKLQPHKAIFGLLLAVIVTGAFAGTGSAASGSSAANKPLHVTKECSQYTGLADSFCTITSSNFAAIPAGSRVVYLQGAGPASLDSDIVLMVGPGNYALGHVTLDFATGTGEVTISGGTRQFTAFRAEVAVSYLGGPNWAWDGTYHFGRADD
jgi:hypothetical protein